MHCNGELPFSKKYFCHEGRFDPLLDPLLYALAGESDLEASACRGESKTFFCPETIVHQHAYMIFVKTFTLADFGHVIFYPKGRNSLES